MLQTNITHDLILTSLENILYRGGNSNFFVVNLGADYYIQLAASRGAYEVYGEAISNAYLAEDAHLNKDQMNNLVALKWSLPESSADNFQLVHRVDSEVSRLALTELIIKTARIVYGIEDINTDSIILNLE